MESGIALHPLGNVDLDNHIIDQWRKNVGEKNRQHNPLRKGWVDDTNQDRHKADQGTKDPSARIGMGRTDRVGRHIDGTKSKAAKGQMPVPRHGIHHISAATDDVKKGRRGNHPDQDAHHDSPVGDAGVDEEGRAQRQASVEVSPIEPGSKPTKVAHQEIPASLIAVTPPMAACPNAVAPANPSTAVHTASPDMAAG